MWDAGEDWGSQSRVPARTIGIHMFSGAQPGDEKPYAKKLRQVVATIRE